MNKKRYIKQSNFNNDYNGYRGWHDGNYSTKVNWERVGLFIWDVELFYHIR